MQMRAARPVALMNTARPQSPGQVFGFFPAGFRPLTISQRRPAGFESSFDQAQPMFPLGVLKETYAVLEADAAWAATSMTTASPKASLTPKIFARLQRDAKRGGGGAAGADEAA